MIGFDVPGNGWKAVSDVSQWVTTCGPTCVQAATLCVNVCSAVPLSYRTSGTAHSVMSAPRCSIHKQKGQQKSLHVAKVHVHRDG